MRTFFSRIEMTMSFKMCGRASKMVHQLKIWTNQEKLVRIFQPICKIAFLSDIGASEFKKDLKFVFFAQDLPYIRYFQKKIKKAKFQSHQRGSNFRVVRLDVPHTCKIGTRRRLCTTELFFMTLRETGFKSVNYEVYECQYSCHR